MTENKRFEMIITGADGSFHYLDKNTGEKITSTLELENKLNTLHEENQVLKRHIKANTLKKIKVEDIFNCAKYDKFYNNKEAIKSINWIAEQLGIDFE